MRRVTSILVLAVVATSCSSSTPTTATPPKASSPSPSPTLGADQVLVPSSANIFGAGRDAPPAPGGGGAGRVPVLWQLPLGARRIVTFPSITGMVNPGTRPQANGAGGDGFGPTDIESFQGISGIIDRKNGMFLVGVFVTNAPPADPAPARLDFTGAETFALLKPKIGQTFFIGDGAGRKVEAPAAATRLFLGFADAAAYSGPPGYYGNNSGHLIVTVKVAVS